jgi:hypothetical protein
VPALPREHLVVRFDGAGEAAGGPEDTP